jgi:outer membrane protein insertion porin family
VTINRLTPLLLGAALLSGCATWQRPPQNGVWSPDAQQLTPAQSSAPTPANQYSDAVVRYQSPSNPWSGYNANSGGPSQASAANYWQQPGQTPTQPVQQTQFSQPLPPPSAAPGAAPGFAPSTVPQNYGPPAGYVPSPQVTGPPAYAPSPNYGVPAGVNPNAAFDPNTPIQASPWGQAPFDPNAPNPFANPDLGLPTPMADVIVNLQETQTGRLMVGAAVNSDAGVTGQIVIDEKNFDWQRIPTSWDDWANGTAFRGAGQGFRLEALPGDEVQRYMFQFTEPYLWDTRISFNASGFLFTRRFFDWDEERIGGRLGFGYRISPDLSVSGSLRAEQVTISDPRVAGVPELDAAIGEHDLFGARISITQDTRDIPFAPTQGYFFEASFEQVFGSFDYSRGNIDYRRYFLVTERPDGSGRHVLGFSNRLGITGSQTPIFEQFFAGGYSTLRGFDFRGATPKVNDVAVGGELSLLGSVEYLFPITADDMLKGIVFCDYGTIEEDISIDSDDYRVSLGAGLRISVPAMGPAPIALDFAVPIAREDTDDIRQFSFFMGLAR